MEQIIVFNLLILASYIMFAGLLRSKYYEMISHKGIEKSEDILCIFMILLGVLYLFTRENQTMQVIIFLSMYVGELVALVYALYVMPHLTFKYKRQRRFVKGALVCAFAFAIIQAGSFLCYFFS